MTTDRHTPTSTDDERDKETAARIREINLLLIDGKCTPEYAYERIEEIVKEQLNANQPQTDEVKPTPVGEFNYRPAVSVRSDNQPQTELDEILDDLYYGSYLGPDTLSPGKAKQAILDWHNKQMKDPFDYIEPCKPDCSKERHAYHQGQWDMAHRMADLGLTSKESEL